MQAGRVWRDSKQALRISFIFIKVRFQFRNYIEISEKCFQMQELKYNNVYD